MLIKNNQYNIGHICSTLQCEKGFSEKVAFKFITSKFQEKFYTFKELDSYSNQVANILQILDINKGDIVFTFLSKAIPINTFIANAPYTHTAIS